MNAGASGVAPAAHPLGSLAFGARYTGYHNLERFLNQTDDLDPGLIVWPGGTLAETRDDRYGLEYEGLWADASRPSLGEMMAAARAGEAGLSVVLPTARYEGDPDALRADLRPFLADLLGGEYGALPETLILEIGAEYYANLGSAGAYAELAEVYLSESALALADPTVNTLGADLTLAVQAGRTLAEDEVIRDGLSDLSLSAVDMIVHHRFPVLPDGVDGRIGEVEAILAAWEEAADDPALFLSAWNVATLTREDALADWAEATGGDPADVDLAARDNAAFEAWWQDRLATYAYGEEHPAALLELFHSYAAAGMEAGAVFGSDWVHPGRLSFREGGTDHDFVGDELIGMLHESVAGTRAMEPVPYDRDGVTPYGFLGEDRMVMFLAGGRRGGGEVTLEVEGLGSDFVSLWAESLTAIVAPDWMERHGIPDNAEVDESPEGQTYAEPVVTPLEPEIAGGRITLTLGRNEVVRLMFARTEAGAEALSRVSGADEIDLTAMVDDDIPTLPPVTEDPAEDDWDEDDDDEGGGGGGGGGAGALAALLLIPILALAG